MSEQKTPALTWTREKPKQPGRYWTRWRGKVMDIVEVTTTPAELVALGWYPAGTMGWGNPISDEWEPLREEREWAGPIAEPLEASVSEHGERSDPPKSSPPPEAPEAREGEG